MYVYVFLLFFSFVSFCFISFLFARTLAAFLLFMHQLLVLSDRVTEDLEKALEYGEIFFTAKVVLREWIDEVPNRPEMEFRG